MGRLEGKVAIITGSGRGIGRGIALAYAREGAKVVVVDWVASAVEDAVQEISQLHKRVLGVVCDVGDEDEVKRMVGRTVEKFGRVDILVNNAQAWGPKGGHDANIPLLPLEELSEDVWDNTFQTGVKATFYCCKAVFPYMRDTGGKIINFGSYWGMVGKEGAAAYNANKEAIRSLTRTAAREWGKYGINANVICPSAETNALLSWAEEHPEEYQQRVQSMPLGRYGHPEKDIGRVAVFLASDDSNFVTGCTVMADGGLFMSA